MCHTTASTYEQALIKHGTIFIQKHWLQNGGSYVLQSLQTVPVHLLPWHHPDCAVWDVFLCFQAVYYCLKKFRGLIKKCFNWVKSLNPLLFFVLASFLCVGESFLLSFRGLTKVTKIATKLSVSNSCM